MDMRFREVTIARCNFHNARSQMMHGNNNIGSCSSEREHVTDGLEAPQLWLSFSTRAFRGENLESWGQRIRCPTNLHWNLFFLGLREIWWLVWRVQGRRSSGFCPALCSFWNWKPNGGGQSQPKAALLSPTRCPLFSCQKRPCSQTGPFPVRIS